MTSGLYRVLAAAALLAGAASSPAVAEEAKRPWTDPPVSQAPADETVTYPDAPVSQPGKLPAAAASLEGAPSQSGLPSPEPTETSSVEPKTDGKSDSAVASGSHRSKEGTAPTQPIVTAEPAGATTGTQPAPARSAAATRAEAKIAKKVTQRRTKAASVKPAARTKAASRTRQAPSRRSVVAAEAAPRGSVGARPGYRRLRSVAEALDAGLMVTTVRTIQLPDGRRIEIESEPDPRTRLDVVVRPF